MRSTTRFLSFLGGNLITWKSKKQSVVSRSSTEIKYRAMAHTLCELMWIKHCLEELRLDVWLPMTMYCDKQEAIHIASNLVFHEHIKHKEGDYNQFKGKWRVVRLLPHMSLQGAKFLICS